MSGCPQDIRNPLGFRDKTRFELGMDQAALDEDLEGAPAAFAQAHRCAALDAQSVRKTCGALGIARSYAAIENPYLHVPPRPFQFWKYSVFLSSPPSKVRT